MDFHQRIKGIHKSSWTKNLKKLILFDFGLIWILIWDEQFDIHIDWVRYKFMSLVERCVSTTWTSTKIRFGFKQVSNTATRQNEDTGTI